jgi:hypothetical protein
MKGLIAGLLFSLSIFPANAADKCDALAPTNAQNVDEKFKGKIEGQIQGIVAKLAGGAASIEGDFEKIETDQLNGYPDSDKLYVWQRIIYLACVSPDQKIDLNNLFILYLQPYPKSKSANSGGSSSTVVMIKSPVLSITLMRTSSHGPNPGCSAGVAQDCIFPQHPGGKLIPGSGAITEGSSSDPAHYGEVFYISTPDQICVRMIQSTGACEAAQVAQGRLIAVEEYPK